MAVIYQTGNTQVFDDGSKLTTYSDGVLSSRDTGGNIKITKPDGTPIIDFQTPTQLANGLAQVTTGSLPTSPFGTTSAASVIPSILQSNPKQTTTQPILPAVFRNPLENFASYSAIWTLACLEPKQLNNPTSYRNSPAELKNIVFASAGRFDSQRSKVYDGESTRAPEYFINNFIMKAAVAPGEKTGNTSAFNFEFEIYEPYSMGLLLQSLQVAATNAGYINYLDNAAYVLRLDFTGFNEQGIELKTVKPKFFILRFTKVTFNVQESGSVYRVEAVPFNHIAFSNVINTVFTDVSIQADKEGTVEEVLNSGPKSLMKFLNDNEEKLYKENRIGLKDQYVIQFPPKSSDFTAISTAGATTVGATVDPKATPKKYIKGTNVEIQTDFETNTIGSSSLGFTQSSGGNYVMKLEGDQRDEKTGVVQRDNMTIDPKNRSFQFSQGQSITSIINQIVLSSDYAKKALDPNNLTAEGYIKWFKLDVQVELLDQDPLTADFAMRFTFRVVPYLVHHTIFANPNAAPIGYSVIQNQISKGYEYIYSGQNVDVLKFDIQINNLFYTGINSSAETESANVVNQDQKGVAAQQQVEAKTGEGPAKGEQLANLGRKRVKRDPELLTKTVGGSGDRKTELVVAEAFHKSFLSMQGDLIKVNLEILGDPYWMVDSGIGNYFSPSKTGNTQVTQDETMDYESGDVYVYLTFKTPFDINEGSGLYDFTKAAKVSPFSGIYRITACENRFSEGTFKQTLTCVRLPGQATDFVNAPTEVTSNNKVDKKTSMATQTGQTERTKTSVVDDPTPNTTGFA